jgi:hypothetical protein
MAERTFLALTEGPNFTNWQDFFAYWSHAPHPPPYIHPGSLCPNPLCEKRRAAQASLRDEPSRKAPER